MSVSEYVQKRVHSNTKMTESKYKIIQMNQNVHTDQEEDDDGDEEEDLTDNLDDDTVTIVPASDPNDLHFPNKFNENNNMQTPTAILTLILIYFTLSIGLTFYQRNLLNVRSIIMYSYQYYWQQNRKTNVANAMIRSHKLFITFQTK